MHVVCDGQGRPLGVVLTPGQQHESTVFEAVMDTVCVPQRGRPLPPPRPQRSDQPRYDQPGYGQRGYDRERYDGPPDQRQVPSGRPYGG